MSNKLHVHKFKRFYTKTGAIWYFCVNNCNYQVSADKVLGKITQCWICSKEFEMTEYSRLLAKPHCSDCYKPRKSANETITESESKAQPNIIRVEVPLKDKLAALLGTAADTGVPSDEEDL